MRLQLRLHRAELPSRRSLTLLLALHVPQLPEQAHPRLIYRLLHRLLSLLLQAALLLIQKLPRIRPRQKLPMNRLRADLPQAAQI